jgi:hypothetical protein
MRTFALLAALIGLLAVPTGSLGSRASTKDGTLSVKEGDGLVSINGRGAVIGRVDRVVKITLTDFKEDDGSGPAFTGCESMTQEKQDDGDGTVSVCSGKGIKFKLIGGTYKIKIVGGRGIDLSVVGRSEPDKVQIDGDGDIYDDLKLPIEDGMYSFDGEPYRSLPNKLTKFQLGS